jgi:hypothetical protein
VILRSTGVYIHRRREISETWMSLAEHPNEVHAEGELQIVPHFEDMVSAAVIARRQFLRGQERALASHDEREALSDRADTALRRLHDARR